MTSELARKFLEENFPQPISLRDAARAAHVSPAHLSRQFRSEQGEPLTVWLQRRRVRHACEMLARSGEPILAIALDSGFPSVEHFYRIFRRVVGQSPRASRRTHRSS